MTVWKKVWWRLIMDHHTDNWKKKTERASNNSNGLEFGFRPLELKRKRHYSALWLKSEMAFNVLIRWSKQASRNLVTVLDRSLIWERNPRPGFRYQSCKHCVKLSHFICFFCHLLSGGQCFWKSLDSKFGQFGSSLFRVLSKAGWFFSGPPFPMATVDIVQLQDYLSVSSLTPIVFHFNLHAGKSKINPPMNNQSTEVWDNYLRW